VKILTALKLVGRYYNNKYLDLTKIIDLTLGGSIFKPIAKFNT
jgi:hypothetical protein